MPELPEIETLVLELREVLEAREIVKAEVRGESILQTPRSRFERELPGRCVLQVGRVGKYIRIHLSGNWILWFHLGMTGQLLFEDPPSAMDPHLHLALSFAGSLKWLFYRDVRRFGRVALTAEGETRHPKGVRYLGPEPKEWDREAFVSLFKERRARIKSLLLNQRLVSGLGNIYADESLHRAGIHPFRRARLIPRRRLLRLHAAICEVLEEAIHWGGSSIEDYLHVDGSRGRFQEFHRVYGREGENCRACGVLIRKIKFSGRSSSFCPRCQR